MNQHAFGKQNYAHAECKNAHSPKNRSALYKEKMTKFILEKIFKCISNICFHKISCWLWSNGSAVEATFVLAESLLKFLAPISAGSLPPATPFPIYWIPSLCTCTHINVTPHTHTLKPFKSLNKILSLGWVMSSNLSLMY